MFTPEVLWQRFEEVLRRKKNLQMFFDFKVFFIYVDWGI